MIRNIWGDPERFKKSYFPSELRGYYLAGDGARDADGYFWIMGRIDDVLNVSGHRLGTMEVESALVAHELVAEAAVVGRPTTPPAKPWWPSWCSRARPEGEEAQAIAKQLRDWVARRSAPSPSPRTSASATTCPRRVPARSCAACCAWSPRARKHPGRVHAGKPRHPGSIGQVAVDPMPSGPARRPSASWTKRRAAPAPRAGRDARNGIRYGRLCFPIPIHLESPQ